MVRKFAAHPALSSWGRTGQVGGWVYNHHITLLLRPYPPHDQDLNALAVVYLRYHP